MHDTALHLGKLAFETYCRHRKASILELGSYDVNGSLRSFAPADSKYVGIDFGEGPGVDVVVTPGAMLPFDDEQFDFVAASSVLEHDPAFWSTFLEIARVVRPGGFIYINAPSNGAIHRYPEDLWRFYPDAGKALSRWANSKGIPLRLIESFIAPRQADIWNDFVAVFAREPSESKIPEKFLHQHFRFSSNIQVGDADEYLNPTANTEDMELISRLGATLRQRNEDIQKIDAERLLAQTQADDNARKLIESRSQNSQLKTERDAARDLVNDIKKERDRAENEISDFRRQIEEGLKETVKLQAEINEFAVQLANRNSALREARSEASYLSTKLTDAEQQISDRFAETAAFTRILIEMEAKQASDHAGYEVMRRVYMLMADAPWWWSFLPKSWRYSRIIKRLAANDLFHGKEYLEANPDVASFGMNALRHYILHGIPERRKIRGPIR